MSKSNTSAIKKRFEKLVSLNVEGIASAEENLELWNILRQPSNLKAEFIQTRNIHYLLKVSCDPSASEMAFARRFKGTPQSSRLKEKDFLVSVQNRLIKATQKKKKRQFAYPILKTAASVLIVLGCAVLLKNLFFHTQKHFPEISKSEETFLAWNFEPDIAELKKGIAMFYGAPLAIIYLYADSENEIVIEKEKINDIFSRSEKLWP